MLNKSLLGIGFCSCLLLSGCKPGEQLVQEAAQQRWEALIVGDYGSAYRFYTDAFKETVPLQHFRNKIKGVGFWSSAKVESVDCEKSGQRCEAAIEVAVTMKMRGLPKPVKTTDIVRETWVKEGVFSDWRYLSK